MNPETSFSVVKAGQPAVPAEAPVLPDDLEGYVLHLGPIDDGTGEIGREREGEPEEHEVKVQKRQAHAIAMAWLKDPFGVETHEVQGKAGRNYVLLRVRVANVWEDIAATSWWLALRALQSQLAQLGMIELKPGGDGQ